jgi:hypothetical protein
MGFGDCNIQTFTATSAKERKKMMMGTEHLDQ